MNTFLAGIIYPIFSVVYYFARSRNRLNADMHRWCKWKNVKYSSFRVCQFFVSDKAFRNLFYYRSGPIRVLLSCFFRGYDHLQITTPSNHIEGGLIFQHGFSTIVSAEKIGKDCKIYQQVTIGYNHKLKAPIIGDKVEICCGAKIIGGIRIGNNVLIGANAVVIHDIPDNSVVAGVPAKVIGMRDI